MDETMMNIGAYQTTQKLYEGANSLIYRARHGDNGQPVVLKILKARYPSSKQIARFKRGYEMAQSLNLAGVVAVLGLETDQHRRLMVLEDFGGVSIDRLGLAGQLTLVDFLRLAIDIAQILSQLHQKRIIHKDINPSHLVLNPTTSQVKLIDFGISTVLSRENPTFRSPNALEGTLAYISPEQTGRMNRTIDYRTDFYSLGVTFYELLTGQLPFQSNDLLELIHSHLAKQPLPPHHLNLDIPPPVSQLILKLMAKNAEDRYQSGQGLQADLETCLTQWQETGHITPFPLEENITLSRFQIPQQLYGREAEIKTLLAAFDRVAHSETKELMLVSGYSGIGKTALVQEVYKPLTRRRGYFIRGKFDQFKRNIPYAALIQAFRLLVQQLLTEREDELAACRESLLATLGTNGQVIVEVIPELELIIGPQPAAPSLPPVETENRFNRVFRKFLSVLAQKKHPLVIFLDDLQWADSASLKLLQRIFTDSEIGYLFVIGAYRDNEVSQAHPLRLRLEEMREAETVIHEINLKPLTLLHVIQLVSDTFRVDEIAVKPLAELVYNKTHGNPFFVNQFLQTLYEEELVTFETDPMPDQNEDQVKKGWQWDLAKINVLDSTDNVVELMVRKIRRLPANIQQTLTLAACIGNQFNIQTLLIINGQSSSETEPDLWKGVEEGLIIPVNTPYSPQVARKDEKPLDQSQENTTHIFSRYKFLHDRIQQAAYGLMSDDQKKRTHLQIGRLLLEHTDSEKQIFDLINHLNIGSDLITQAVEREKLARLNLVAGQKAKASAAYQPAFSYLQRGIDLLMSAGVGTNDRQSSWRSQYDLTLALYLEAAEAAYLSGGFQEMEHLIEVVLDQAKTLSDKVKAYDIKLQAYTVQRKFVEALQIGRSVLALLGIQLPKKPNQWHFRFALLRLKFTLFGKRVEDLINLPPMTNPNALAAMRITDRIFPATYLSDPPFFRLLVLNQINLSIKYGNSSESILAYATYGLLLCGPIGEIEAGYQFGQLALNLLARLEMTALKPKILVSVAVYVRHWKEPLREVLTGFREAYEIGLETGNFEWTFYASIHYCFYSLLTSDKNLRSLANEIVGYMDTFRQLKQTSSLHHYQMMQQFISNLANEVATPDHLSGLWYDETEMLPRHVTMNDKMSIFVLHFYKLMLCYLFQAYPNAVTNAIIIEKYIHSGVAAALPFIPIFYFYDSLAHLAIYLDSSLSEQKRILAKVQTNQEKMKKWADHAPPNCLHKYYLVEAEQARVLEQDGEAREHYDKAIEAAREHRYLNEEALANELAARFYLTKDNLKLAQLYLIEARNGYARWGATTKVKALEEAFPQLLVRSIDAAHSLTEALSATSFTLSVTLSQTNEPNLLDIATVIKATQAISEEVVLSSLLKKIVKIAIETTGAQQGFLILKRDGRWQIEAAAVADAKDEVESLQAIPLENNGKLSEAIVYYTIRTGQDMVLHNAAQAGPFTEDPHVVKHQSKSILCTPLRYKNEISEVLYLENDLTTNIFTKDRIEVLHILLVQAAISLENALLYENLTREMAEQKRTEAALRRNEERFRALFERSNDAVFIMNLEGIYLTVNQQAADMLGYTITDLIGMSYKDVIVPSHFDEAQGKLNLLLAGKKVPIYERLLRRKDGSIFPVEINIALVSDEQGQPLHIQSIARDITERKQIEAQILASLEEKEIMLKEIHHRVKNNMQIISSLLDLQTDMLQDEQVRGLFKESQQRIRSMALVHEQLYQSSDLARIDFAEYIERLTDHLLRSYGARADNVTLHLDIAPLSLSIETAIPCGLIINELISNAFKHAFPDDQAGEIWIEVQPADNQRLSLAVRDDGVGLPSGFDFRRTPSLGLTLVNTLIKQLNGAIELNRGKGTEFAISFAA